MARFAHRCAPYWHCFHMPVFKDPGDVSPEKKAWCFQQQVLKNHTLIASRILSGHFHEQKATSMSALREYTLHQFLSSTERFQPHFAQTKTLGLTTVLLCTNSESRQSCEFTPWSTLILVSSSPVRNWPHASSWDTLLYILRTLLWKQWNSGSSFCFTHSMIVHEHRMCRDHQLPSIAAESFLEKNFGTTKVACAVWIWKAHNTVSSIAQLLTDPKYEFNHPYMNHASYVATMPPPLNQSCTSCTRWCHMTQWSLSSQNLVIQKLDYFLLYSSRILFREVASLKQELSWLSLNMRSMPTHMDFRNYVAVFGLLFTRLCGHSLRSSVMGV